MISRSTQSLISATTLMSAIVLSSPAAAISCQDIFRVAIESFNDGADDANSGLSYYKKALAHAQNNNREAYCSAMTPALNMYRLATEKFDMARDDADDALSICSGLVSSYDYQKIIDQYNLSSKTYKEVSGLYHGYKSDYERTCSN